MIANSELIKWLLEESEVTKYRISKATGIHQTTLSNLENGTSLIENLSFKNAIVLTKYAEMIKEEKKMLKVIYTDTTDNNKMYVVAVITTNHSMTIDQALELAGVNMDDWAHDQGWDGYDYESLTME